MVGAGSLLTRMATAFLDLKHGGKNWTHFSCPVRSSCVRSMCTDRLCGSRKGSLVASVMKDIDFGLDQVACLG